MLTSIDASYFEQRADTETRMAAAATHPNAASAHRALARMYLNLARSETMKRIGQPSRQGGGEDEGSVHPQP